MLAAVYPAWLARIIRSCSVRRALRGDCSRHCRRAGLGCSLSDGDNADRAWLRGFLLVEAASLLRLSQPTSGCVATPLRSSAPRNRWTSPSSPAARARRPCRRQIRGLPASRSTTTTSATSSMARSVACQASLPRSASTWRWPPSSARPPSPRSASPGTWSDPGWDLASRRPVACSPLFAVAISGNLYAPWRLIQDPTRHRLGVVVGQCRRALAGARAASSVMALASTTIARSRPPRRSTSSHSSVSCLAIFTPT